MTITEHRGGGSVPSWTLGERLRKARAYAQMTVDDMAAELGCTTKTIYNYEQDRSSVRLPTLREWARITDVRVEWIQWGVDHGNNGGSTVDTQPVTVGYDDFAPSCYPIAA